MALLISPLISVLVKKAGDSLIEQFCRMRGMDENRKKLHRHLLAIQEKIADAEERGVGSPVVQEWMKELHAAALKAADVLDEFQYEALRQKAISQQPSASTKVIKGCFSSKNPIIFRYKISNKMTKLLGTVDEIVTEMNKFNFVPRDAVPTIDRETQSLVIESEVIGREGEIEEIVNVLLDPQREGISVLPIVGMGGLGKTTLAQLIYNDERVKGSFELLMWVCVSNEFNVVNIIKSIIEVATNEGAISMSNKELLQRQLLKNLDGKRYLLVLDDVWNEEREKWNDLKTPLTYGARSGSIIVVTTRSKEVASIMGTLPRHDLESLNKEDSWKLFQKRAFGEGGEEQPKELNKFGKMIICKCAGLPLALTTIGGLMRSKREVHEWRDVAENITWGRGGEGCANNIFPILKLSYHHLPSHIKQCFAFCAIFPQDHMIERETLIQLWMANDFIPTDEKMNLEEKGRCIFNELYLRSFLQEIKETEEYYCPIITCKMHDLMHDLATKVSGRKCCTMLEPNYPIITQKEVQHLSLSGTEFSGINNLLKQFPNIHTYLADKFYPPKRMEKHYYFLKSSSLRALQFRSDLSLPKEFGYMKHIRYLDLSFSSFEALPKTISTLYNLQTLKLCHSSIRELPEDMRYMTNLRHLLLDDCPYLKCMPIGLGQLQLQTLTQYIVDSGTSRGIGELNNLNLSGRLRLCGLEMVRDRDAKEVNLAAKSNLYSLEFVWSPTNNEERRRNNEAVLEVLTPHNELKCLGIYRYGGSSFPKWMMEGLIIKNLKKLNLESCFDCVVLPPVYHLPLLDELRLKGMFSLLYIVGGTCVHAERRESLTTFPNLRVLKLHSLLNLKSWHEKDSELVQFPKLDELVISKCPKLKLDQVSKLPNLSDLHIGATTISTEPGGFRIPKTVLKMGIDGLEDVSPLIEEDNPSFQAASVRDLKIRKTNCFSSCRPTKLALGFWKCFAVVESLMIWSCDALVFWPMEELRSLPCLKYLEFQSCNNLTGLSQVSSSQTPHEEDSLPQLKSLMFWGCPELVKVPGCSRSLKELCIKECNKLSSEGLPELSNLTALYKLHLSSCPNWRALPDGMEHLASLENLYLSSCPGIKSFSEGLRQRLHALRSLRIEDCPSLERRCRRGGDYWHLVSPIPELYLSDVAEEAKCQNFLRLLPICGK